MTGRVNADVDGSASREPRQLPTVSRGRQLLAATVGNAIEWFDWIIYSLLAVTFAPLFFPSESSDSLVPLLSALAVFAVGFVFRPLGGFIVGFLADRFGRKRMLSLTVVGMGVGSLVIAVLPTYASIGVLAPIILVFARLIQGMSAGGEYAAAATFLVESAPERRRGLYSSFFYLSSTIGNLLGMILCAVLVASLSPESMSEWGWRLPFALGAVGAFVGLWVRRRATETHAELGRMEAGDIARTGPFDFLRFPKKVLQTIGLTAAGALIFYVWTSYMPTYANITTGFDLSQGLMVSVIATSFLLVLQPLMGWISDRVGRKPLLIVFGVAFTFGTVPMMSLLNGELWTLLLVQGVGLIVLSGWTSIINAVFAELWPTRIRASGMGLPYSTAVALFGGTGPYVATWFVEMGHPEWFAYYVSILALVSTLTIFTLKETAFKPLPRN